MATRRAGPFWPIATAPKKLFSVGHYAYTWLSPRFLQSAKACPREGGDRLCHAVQIWSNKGLTKNGQAEAKLNGGEAVGHITYVWTSEGWLYLAVILDLHSRRVVGWAVSDRMKKDLAIRALEMAVNLRQPAEGCIFHSDRGSQYCSYNYQKKWQAYGLRSSMSGKGNCYDKASVETLLPPFGRCLRPKSLKAELIWRQKWKTRRQAEAAIFQYINGF